MIYIKITAVAHEALVAWDPNAIQAVEPSPDGGFTAWETQRFPEVGRELQRSDHPSLPRAKT
jgi:hypothetical protein